MTGQGWASLACGLMIVGCLLRWTFAVDRQPARGRPTVWHNDSTTSYPCPLLVPGARTADRFTGAMIIHDRAIAIVEDGLIVAVRSTNGGPIDSDGE